MPTVYDNIDTPFLENDCGNGLKDALKVAKRGDSRAMIRNLG